MQKLKEHVGVNGLCIPTQIMEEYGIKEGSSVTVELDRGCIKIFPKEVTPDEIENNALGYLLENVGDAVVIEKPEFCKDKWNVPVLYAEKEVGRLVFSKSGGLISDESSAPREIIERINED
ncbi:MAG: hypothetical protein A7316_09965 [Candidatus Altiarchaeales archaeon WOR_SM1_86-2]|nr:MAG: hypothetical protein A7316_09965 [Candidatus Altiarchaeales archaeon WOR_SM1_86-2]ODS37824.1 MAG: hypothetical protein A7315_13140 [Candidatus Altiarchaeales archaeon WOR_SM1_79]